MDPIPKLQPPGAGLPWWELLIAKHLVFPHACRKLTWAASAEQFQEEGALILTLWDSLPAEQLKLQVLVLRLRGMEDSSRFWSVAMTVEHLNIVGTAIRRTISSLRRGDVPKGKARTADVKPQGTIELVEVRAAFVQLLADAAAAERNEPPIQRGQGPQLAHPWFGPLDAFQWHCLLGFHQALHRKQIEAICKGLTTSTGPVA